MCHLAQVLTYLKLAVVDWDYLVILILTSDLKTVTEEY